MAAPLCSQCGGTRWVRYFSETKDGAVEEAFRLCPCNHEVETRAERACEESGHAETAGGTSLLDRGAQDPI